MKAERNGDTVIVTMTMQEYVDLRIDAADTPVDHYPVINYLWSVLNTVREERTEDYFRWLGSGAEKGMREHYRQKVADMHK